MNWIRPPETVRRFTIHQIVQHGFGAVLWAVLLGSSIASGIGVPAALALHAGAGVVAAGFLVYHGIFLTTIGIRADLPVQNVAFLPWGGGGWAAIRRREGKAEGSGKYSPSEKGDYLAILCWSMLAAATGILLRWPSALGIPGASAYSWIRAAHAGFGAALTIHLLVAHLPGRWFLAPAAFRRAILTGTVPRIEAEARGGWVHDLVAAGVLVPVPAETVSVEEMETGTVRELLERGNRCARDGNFSEACEAYREALHLFPGYSQARYNLAVALLRWGRLEEGKAEMRRFIEDDPFNPMAEKGKMLLEENGDPAR